MSVVVKLGGSILRDPDDLLRAADIVASYIDSRIALPVVVVVSAFHGVTDRLLGICDAPAAARASAAAALSSDLYDFCVRALDGCAASHPARNTVLRAHADVTAAMDSGQREHVACQGERLAAILLAAVLDARRVGAQCLFPEDLGLLAAGPAADARVDFVHSAAPVRARLAGVRVAVVPGFYGVAADGRVALFGRGGSDYSAAALAALLDAESVDLWKDVAGFHRADPRLVPDALPLANLPYDAAADSAFFGARILHPRALEPLAARGIPLRIFDLEQRSPRETPRTVIHLADGAGTTCVASTDDVLVLHAHARDVESHAEMLPTLSATCARNGAAILGLLGGRDGLDIVVRSPERARTAAALHALVFNDGARLMVRDDVALVALVGASPQDVPQLAAEAIAALAARGIRVHACLTGSRASACAILVDRSARTAAVRIVHAALLAADAAAGLCYPAASSPGDARRTGAA